MSPNASVLSVASSILIQRPAQLLFTAIPSVRQLVRVGAV